MHVVLYSANTIVSKSVNTKNKYKSKRQQMLTMVHFAVFKTDIEIVKYCQNIFRFELPSVRLSRLKTRFLASYSSVDNSMCRHILIHGWPCCFCWYIRTWQC